MTRATYFGTYCLLLSLLVAGGVYASLTHAQEGTTTPRTERQNEIKANIEERRGEIQENIQERQAEIASSTEEFKEQLSEHKAAFAKKVQDRIYNLTQNIRGRMNAAIRRLEHIAGRIETRTNKMEIDESAKSIVRNHLSDARASLDEASSLLAPDLGLFVQSDNPREKFRAVFDTIKKAGEDIRAARESLRLALGTLKSAIQTTDTGRVSEAVSSASSTDAVSE